MSASNVSSHATGCEVKTICGELPCDASCESARVRIVPMKRPRDSSPPQQPPLPFDSSRARGENMLMNTENLPLLPLLPPKLANLPYIRHVPGHYSSTSSPQQIAAHKFHRRQETVGDSVAKVFVVHWLINCHPHLEVQVASVFSNALLSNALFSRLAVCYGMHEKINANRHADGKSDLPQKDHKALADAYEAYLGIAFREVMAGTRPWTDLSDYFAKLLTPEVFPDLEQQITDAQAAADHGFPYNGQPGSRSPNRRKRSSASFKPAPGPPSPQKPPRQPMAVASGGQQSHSRTSRTYGQSPTEHCGAKIQSPHVMCLSGPPSTSTSSGSPYPYGAVQAHSANGPKASKRAALHQSLQVSSAPCEMTSPWGKVALPLGGMNANLSPESYRTHNDVPVWRSNDKAHSFDKSQPSNALNHSAQEPRVPDATLARTSRLPCIARDEVKQLSKDASTMTMDPDLGSTTPRGNTMCSVCSGAPLLFGELDDVVDLVIVPRIWVEEAVHLLRQVSSVS